MADKKKTAAKPKKLVKPRIDNLVLDTALPIHGVHVGLDLSLTSSAVAVLKAGRMEVTRLRPGSLRSMDRLEWFAVQLAQFAQLHANSYTIEGYSFGSTSRAHALGELGGLARMTLCANGGCPFICPPTTLKKFVTGKGNAPGKGAVILSLFKRWDFDIPQDDQADAAALALFGAYRCGGIAANGLTAAQHDALLKSEQIGFARNIARPRTGPTMATPAQKKLQPVSTG